MTAQKGGYKHFLLKEIHEQPQAIIDTMRGRILQEEGDVQLDVEVTATVCRRRSKRCVLVACGTAWHACLVGKFLIERLAGIPCEVDYGSEFRYRDPVLEPGTLLIVVSQSGETADTLAAVEAGRERGVPVLAICNVVDSSIARRATRVLYTHAGPEISVASTKAFTTQLTALYLLALYLGRQRGAIDADRGRQLLSDLVALPALVKEALGREKLIERVAKKYGQAQDILYLGRGVNYPVALEGALKLKEISYIHAEGYPAGEMKHGPIALINDEMPVVVLIPHDAVFEKTLSNLKEVEARGGRIIVVTDAPHRGPGRRRVGSARGARHQRAADPDPADPAAPVAGVPRGGLPRHRRRPAAQPGEERDGRVGPPASAAVQHARQERAVGVAFALDQEGDQALLDGAPHRLAHGEDRGLVGRRPAQVRGLDRWREAEVEALGAWQRGRADPAEHRGHDVGAGREPPDERPERRRQQVVGVGQDVEGVVGADGRDRDDGIPVLHRQTGEAGAPPPDQRVALALALEDLAPAAGEHQDRLAPGHERVHVFGRAVDHAKAVQQVPPERHLEVQVVAQRPDEDAASFPEAQDEERRIEHAHQGMVAGQQEGAVAGHVLDPLELRRGQPAPWRQQKPRRVDLGARWTVSDAHAPGSLATGPRPRQAAGRPAPVWTPEGTRC